MPPTRRKSTQYKRPNPVNPVEGEQEERKLSPQEQRRQMMIHAGVWFLVLVFAMTSGIMCFNIGGGSQQQAARQAQQAPQDPVQAEIDRWTREVETSPNDAVALANLGHYWVVKSGTLRSAKAPQAPPPSPVAGSPAPAKEMTREEAMARAEEYLQRALEKDPKYVFAIQEMAQLRISQEKLPEARQLLESILTLVQEPIPQGEDPATIQANRATQAGRARLVLASLESEAQNYGKALEYLDQVQKDEPGNPQVYGLRAAVLEKQGRVDEALVALDSLAKMGEGTQNLEVMLGARLEKARLLKDRGDKPGARVELEKAKAVAPRP